MSDTHAARLARLYEGWSEGSLTSASIGTASMGVLDVAGCIVGGSATATAEMVRGYARELGAGTGSSVLGTGLRLAPPLAAFANGVAGHVLDYDDMSSTLVGHPSVVLVPAILAVGEAQGASGRAILSAYVLGFEVDCHFGRAMIPSHYDAGWHSTSSLGVFGAAAAVSRLLGLDGAGMLNALAIAASNVAGLRANFGTMTKSLHAGQAAEGGVRAASLSARGFTANTGLFDAEGGFFDAYRRNPQPKPEPATTEIEASGVGIKPYACCGAGVSLVDAALDLRARHALQAADIVSVEAVVSDMATRIMPLREAMDGLQAKYCLAYCAAVALIDGAGGLRQFEDERVLRDDVRALVKRTSVRADSRMASGAGRFGVELAVRTRDGRSLGTSVEVPRGHPSRPLTADQLVAKFMECSSTVLGEARAREAADRLRALEREPDITSMIALLRKG